MRIHLLTASAQAGLALDDRHLLRALRARGVDAEAVVWEDPLADFAAAPLTIVRSTWDYAFRLPFFFEQLEHISRVTTLANPIKLLRYSAHKQYLLALEAAGVAIVPTVLVRRDAAFDLHAQVGERGWKEIVVKPAVGAAGRWTRRFVAGDDQAKGHLARVLAQDDALIQPFLPAIVHEGELSVVVIAGEITHAVRKRGAPGDFRVHEDHGGSVQTLKPDQEVRGLVGRALAAAPGAPLYARVDVVRGLDGELCVMELELVEPELFFAYSEAATARMVDAILALARG
jgi:glutathione synthase/RimK-type ligase-like ATP-grasp enzyme